MKCIYTAALLMFFFTSCCAPGSECLVTTFPEPTTAPTVESVTIPTTIVTTVPPSTQESLLPTTGPTQPSQTDETEPVVTQPTETVPPVTKQPKPQEKPTEPVPTEPSPTVHLHSYSAEVIGPTCTVPGYTVHSCSCGDSYTDGQTPAIGHTYTETVTAPTMWKQGYTTYTCSRCADSYTDNYTAICEAEKEAFIQEVREATLKYINEFREEPAKSLPGLTQVANYRAVQLHSNYNHSTKDLREALAHFQYGKLIAPEGWDPSEYYYDFPGREAISRSSITGSSEEIGRQLAQNYMNSSGHWDYVGSSDYGYIAVGIAYDATKAYRWTCCVFVTDTDQYG